MSSRAFSDWFDLGDSSSLNFILVTQCLGRQHARAAEARNYWRRRFSRRASKSASASDMPPPPDATAAAAAGCFVPPDATAFFPADGRSTVQYKSLHCYYRSTYFPSGF